MPTEQSTEVVHAFFDECFRGLIAPAIERLDPNVVYCVPGSHPLAGSFAGPQAVARHVADLLQLTRRMIDVLKWEDWMIGVNYLSALVDIRVQRPGIVDTLRIVFLVTMSDDDRITGIEVFFSDPAEADRFFT